MVYAEKSSELTKPQIRKKERAEEILTVSMEEFSNFGFERARLDRIAKSAGIAKGTIYLYFDSKEALFEAAISHYIVSVMEDTRADVGQLNGPPHELIRRLIERTYERIVGSHAETIMRILVSEGHRLPWVAELYYQLAIKKFIELLSEIIKYGIATGDFVESETTKVPELIVAPTIFLSINRMVFSKHHNIDKDAYLKGHIEMVMRTLTPLDASSPHFGDDV